MPVSMPIGDDARLWARRWLILAVTAVAISGLFAILIALARVPALGTLFPGAEFYRVALVLHVNLSQGVWFMAFAGVLWSLYGAAGGDRARWAALLLASVGTAGMVLAVSAGGVRPLMSNYLPVLDSPLFLGALALFGLGIFLQALLSWPALRVTLRAPLPQVAQALLLKFSVAATLAVFVLLALTAWRMPDSEGLHYFETLFWGSGHLWQFSLLALLMYCWLLLAGAGAERLPRWLPAVAVCVALLPVLLGFGLSALHEPGSAALVHRYTWLMQWTSWQAPLLLAVGLLAVTLRRPPAPGFALSLLLFVAGLLLGTLIDGQTTLITAHYHGTIGAITLAFMAASYRLLPVLGALPPEQRMVRRQLGFYGYGVLLMMAGLAGAGLMGAPRKTPGELALSLNVETVSRFCLGIGGLCATIGIVMFAVLLLRRLLHSPKMEACSP